MPLDLKFGLNSISTARNSTFEVRGGSELEVCSIQSLEAALRGVDAKFLVDLKFGIASEVGGPKFAARFEVRSIQNLGVAEEGVDAKFEVKTGRDPASMYIQTPARAPPEWKSTSVATIV